MTIQSNIKLARNLLPDPSAYARAMSGFIRSAMSNKAVTEYRIAVMQDGLVDHFNNWHTDCPTAKNLDWNK